MRSLRWLQYDDKYVSCEILSSSHYKTMTAVCSFQYSSNWLWQFGKVHCPPLQCHSPRATYKNYEPHKWERNYSCFAYLNQSLEIVNFIFHESWHTNFLSPIFTHMQPTASHIHNTWHIHNKFTTHSWHIHYTFTINSQHTHDTFIIHSQ